MLLAENHNQLWIPPGFAYGFITLSETAEFLYKSTNFYPTQSERCIVRNDPEIGSADCMPLLSEKGQKGLPLSQAGLID